MQTLVAYVENKPGVLNRVSSLARRLAINIDSLTVGPTENEAIARMTIVAHTDQRGAHRLEASLEKLVDVLLAEDVSTRALLERDRKLQLGNRRLERVRVLRVDDFVKDLERPLFVSRIGHVRRRQEAEARRTLRADRHDVHERHRAGEDRGLMGPAAPVSPPIFRDGIDYDTRR